MNKLKCVCVFKQNYYSEENALVNTGEIRILLLNTLRLSAAVEPIFLAFLSSYMVEAGFSHLNAVLTQQRNRLNVGKRGDFAT